ncbi:helix-turn-helix transcriptional regulator [Cognatishimia sp. MH4019]|uniref:helix-turn-helix domain-containing protein n=1 Tax=Cognatishimia sp. MH4019 TaxID=2854030 RepID=UPI001CD38EA1|nr:helix-turn-helix transcriptional regulator [Cognatishimia sp. MH4019]
MHGHHLQFVIRNTGIIEQITPSGPSIKNICYQIGHNAFLMTNLVIRQVAKLEIVTKMVMPLSETMGPSQKMLIDANLMFEMRPEQIGHRLKLLRTALKMSPSEISDRLSIPRTYWSRFEGGKRPITDQVAALLVQRYGVTLDFLILGKWDKLPVDLAEQMRTVEAELSSKNNSSSD